jgi:hypothetical protein
MVVPRSEVESEELRYTSVRRMYRLLAYDRRHRAVIDLTPCGHGEFPGGG